MGKNRGFTAVISIFLFFSTIALAQTPPDFSWGAGASGYPVEGGDENSDWWNRFPRTAQASRNESGTQHWERFAEDFELASSLNLNSLRISLSWSRLEPSPGEFSEEAFAHYQTVLETLWRRGLTPLVSLEHFVHPIWFETQGAWTNPQSAESFARFSREVVRRLGHLIPLWITFTDPVQQILEGYLKGNFPPRRRNFNDAVLAYGNILQAHLLATQIIHGHQRALPPELNPCLRRAQRVVENGAIPCGVGVTLGMHNFLPAHQASEPEARASDIAVIALMEHLNAFAFLNGARTGQLRWDIPAGLGAPLLPESSQGHHLNLDLNQAIGRQAANANEFNLDWVGLDYYSTWRVGADREAPGGFRIRVPENLDGPQNSVIRADDGSVINPLGLREALNKLASHAPGIPIVVTRNGVADARDSLRRDFLERHITAVEQAINLDHIDVRGYFTESLTDGYTWLNGFASRLGLFEINYGARFERMARNSAVWFRDFLRVRQNRPSPADCHGFVLNFWQPNLTLEKLRTQALRASALGACHFTIPLLFCQQNKTSNEVVWCVGAPGFLQSKEGALVAGQALRELGFSYSLLPIVQGMDGSWRGHFHPANTKRWFASYRSLILELVEQVKTTNPRDFFVGSEMNFMFESFPEYWRDLMREVKAALHASAGNQTKVLIAANWDHFARVSLWDESDYIGISAYFPLAREITPRPTRESLRQGWQPWKALLQETSRRYNKKIYFAEVGYTSKSTAAVSPWEHFLDGPLELDLQRLLFSVLREILAEIQAEFYSLDVWALAPRHNSKPDLGFDIFGKPAQAEVELLLQMLRPR